MKFILALFAIGLIAVSCTTTEPEGQAQRLTMQELNEAPGYAWFPAEMSTYTPRDAYVQDVAANFDTDNQKVCVFVRPSCSCTGTQKLFPQIVKTLISAGVDMDKVEIWSMRSESDGHPYEPDVTVAELPTIWILSEDQPFKRVIEEAYNLANADSLIADAFVP